MTQKIIYKCSWFETKKHKKSDTDMYFLKEKDTYWVFNTDNYKAGLVRIEIIMIDTESNEYKSAVENDEIENR